MARAYTQEELINAFLFRFRILEQEKIDSLRVIAERCYLESGRDKFRVFGSVTPECMREYLTYVKAGGDPTCPSIKHV